MLNFAHRRPLVAPVMALVCVMPGALLAPRAMAQQPTPAANAEDQTLYIGSINGDDVYVRCGAGESYYPFYKIHRGDLVKVTGERFGWSRVAIVGPAFKDAFGFIRYAKGDTSRVRISADGLTATTLGRVDVLAPNLEANNQAKDSWKTLVRLEADQSMRVLETMEDGKEIVHKVSVPAIATGWVSTPLVPKASDEEAEMFKQMLAAKPDAAKPATSDGNSDTSVASNTPGVKPPEVVPSSEQSQPPVTDTAQASDQTPEPEPIVVAAAPEATSKPDKPRDPTLKDVEAAFKQFQKQPIETAEVAPLKNLYLELSERNPDDANVQRCCEMRIHQLDIWAELQEKKLELTQARERRKMNVQEAEAVKAALERSAEYTAVGRVAASNIYDGQSLPKLFRLQDPATGRTIAYLKPDPDYALANRIDIIVGIVGDKTYEEALRLNIITPRRIDVLTPGDKPAGAVAGASESEDK